MDQFDSQAWQVYDDEFDQAKRPKLENQKSKNIFRKDEDWINEPQQPENEESNSDSRNIEPFWSIDDTLFYPLGLQSHYSGGHKSAVVVWSEDYMINFIFKRLTKAKQTKLTKVRISLPGNERILNIFITQYNTLVLMESGLVYYFKSMETMHPIEWLDGVRSISIGKNGFSLIRYSKKEKRIFLEIYEDTMNLSESPSTIKFRYDLTFDDRNLFQCKWEDDRYTLLAVEVLSTNKELLQCIMRGAVELNVGEEIYLFTVSGTVFGLVPDTKNPNETNDGFCLFGHYIEMLCSYSSNIECIQLDFQQQMCIIFLECGSIDIWYLSPIAKTLLRQTHFTGISSNYYDYEYCKENGTFYYTDDTQIVQLKFKYMSTTDTVLVLESFKAIPGIVACTWVESIKQLICLSCNNIFHQVEFSPNNSDITVPSSSDECTALEYEKYHSLYELTPARIAKLLQKISIIRELKEIPNQLHAAIENEYLKQQLINIAQKDTIYSKLIEAHLEYTIHWPNLKNNMETVTLLSASKQSHIEVNDIDSGYALIILKITKNQIFSNNKWYLCITSSNSEVHIFNLSENLMYKTLQIVFPFNRCHNELLPQYSALLYSFITYGSESLLISIEPISMLQNSLTFSKIFSHSIEYSHVQSNVDILKNLLKNYQIINKNSNDVFLNNQLEIYTQLIDLPKHFHITEFIKIYGTNIEHKANTNDKSNCSESNESEIISLYFMSKIKVEMHFLNNKRQLILKCSDVGVLFHTKLYLYYVFKEFKQSHSSEFTETQESYEIEEQRKEEFLEYKANIEFCVPEDISTTTSPLSSTMSQLKNLREILGKLRTESALHIS